MQAYDRLAQEEGGNDGDSEGENVDSEGESHESSAESEQSGGESGIREECMEHKDGKKKKNTKSKKKKGGKGGWRARVDKQGTEEGEELRGGPRKNRQTKQVL